MKDLALRLAHSNYSSLSFWIKAKQVAKTAGREVIEKCLWLHYAAQRPDTPVWAKTIVYSAIAYFILPTDAIPDFIPVSGYADDLLALTSAVATVAAHIDDEVKDQAGLKLAEWFN